MSPTGDNCNDFTEIKLQEKGEKFAHVGVSSGICTYVTESGKLYVNG